MGELVPASCLVSLLCFSPFLCVCVYAPTVARGVISLDIHHRGKFPHPPQKFEQTASAGTDIIKHTHHTREFLAEGFGGTEHGFLPPYDTMVFYSQLLEGCCMHFRSRFPVLPPPSVNPDRKEVPGGFECDSAGKSVSCRHCFYSEPCQH